MMNFSKKTEIAPYKKQHLSISLLHTTNSTIILYNNNVNIIILLLMYVFLE